MTLFQKDHGKAAREEMFRALFETAPGLRLLLAADLTIVAVSEEFLRATMTTRAAISGRSLFDILPPDPGHRAATSVSNLRASLERVLQSGKPEAMATQKYAVSQPGSASDNFEQRYWDAVNIPVRGEDGEVAYVLQTVTDVTGKVQAELQASASDSRLELVLESVNDFAIFSTDIHGIIDNWNSGAENLFGFSAPEILGQHCRVLFTPEDREMRAPQMELQSAITTGRAVDERWHLRKDGRRFFASGFVTPIKDSEGRHLGYTKVARDVTEKKRRDEERERFFRVGADMLCLTGFDGYVKWASPSWEETLGWTLAELSAAPWISFVHPEDRETSLAASERLHRGEPKVKFENRFRSKDGDYRWITWKSTPVVAEALIYKGASDITERKQAEEQLRTSEERYRKLFDSIDEGFCIIEVLVDGGRPVDYRFLEVNPAFEAQTGLREAAGRRMRELAPAHDEHWFEIYGRVAESGEPATFVRESKSLGRWFDVHAFRLGDPSLRRVAVIFKDITEAKLAGEERERLLRELQDHDRRKNEFLAVLAHELRNPLAAIKSAADVAGVNEQEVAWGLDVITRQVRNIAHLVKDLLDISGITLGKVKLEKTPVDPIGVLRHAIEAVNLLIDEKKHQLTTSFTSHDLKLFADAVRLEQIFINLITNAAKYTPSGGRIRISAGVEDAEVVIRVRDNGDGIAPDQLPHIFELFTQGTRPGARSEGGLGIGLSIVRSLVEMHGGSISAASAGRDQGSEFTIRLPAADAPPMAAGDPAHHKGGDAPAALRVLVVDDHADTAHGMERLLRIAGHTVRVAHDGRTALNMARDFHPEAVLLDIDLPEIDGFQVAARLRQEDCCHRALLIAISGYGEAQQGDDARAASFDYHLTKPVDLASLATLLSEPRS